jgi:hypothetical protein
MEVSAVQGNTTELIKLEEFAKRINVGRTTVFEWIKQGKLLPGRHFIKLGRVIRFPWGPELLEKLHEDSDSIPGPAPASKPQQRSQCRTNSGRKAVVDLDY